VANSHTVPDFRSSTGLFSTLRSEHKLKASGKHLFDASVYQTDSATSSFHDMVRSLSKLVGEARPTEFHQMLATLASEGRLMRLYTQNVDGIDTSLPPLETSIPLGMKGPWPRTIQLHGGLEKMVCSKCNHLSEFEAALFEGPLPPPCTACMETDKVRTHHAGKRSHGIGRLRPRIVLYNEHNPDEEAIGTVVSSDLRTRPDALIVVGTSMKIPGVRRIVREMCGVVRGRKGGLTVWINHDSPPAGKEFENCWDLVVKGACDEVASRANMRRWDDDGVDFQTCTESEAERAKARAGEVNVVIRSPLKKTLAPTIPTPGTSPRPSNPILHSPVDYAKKENATSSKITIKLHGPKLPSKPPLGKKRIAKPPAAPSVKITSAFKLTKPAQALGKKSLKPKAKAVPNFNEDSMPMGPIPPQAARNNGPVNGPGKVLFPNLIKDKPVPISIRGDMGFRDVKNRRSDEIVSPTGAIPSGMSGLLN
jgi:NAD+-dependent protein deacetylase SIR2